LCMLHNFLKREIGKLNACAIPNTELTKRCRSLELSKGKEVHSAHHAPVLCLDIDVAEARYLLSGGGDSQVTLCDLQEPVNQEQSTLTPLFTINKQHPDCHSYGVSAIQWYPFDTGMFISGSFDKKLKVWDTNSQAVACEFELTDKVYDLSMSRIATHMMIAAGTGDQKVRLCDLKTAKATHTLIGHRESVWAVEWSAANEYLLATGSVDHSVRVWDIRRANSCLLILDQHNFNAKPDTFNPARSAVTATAHNAAVTSLCFTPTGQYLLSAGNDNRLRLWDLATGLNTLINYPNALNRTPKSNQIAVSNNGKFVYYPSFNSINVYDIYSGDQVGTLQGHLDKVNCCVFHPVFAELYSGGNDNQILVWTPSQDERTEEDNSNASMLDKDNWSDDEAK